MAAGERLRSALAAVTDALLAERNSEGHWSGELSSSALSTATAITALAAVDREAHAELISAGLGWLSSAVHGDGGWGDTVYSKSNISTTALVWAAFGAAGADESHRELMGQAQAWLAAASGLRTTGDFTPQNLVTAIERRYGKDRTFSVPIVMTLALSGRLGADGWHSVRALPFELATLPHQFFGALRLPVVSYALPALIAIGQVIHHHAPTRNPVTRSFRRWATEQTLRVLTTIQPPNGGFLEATPLTSFVTMSLAAMGRREHIVTQRGVAFLQSAARADGSWPIDTNLATWVTTLSIKALAHQHGWASPESRMWLREWLLGQQYRTEHPYTHAKPGGWAWTDLPGGVPDADDTAGVLIALLKLGAVNQETRTAGLAGLRWLLALQNRDGGIPTFCRGWGALPFDRSSPDLTAHALRAWSGWLAQVPPDLHRKLTRAIGRAVRYLAKIQRRDGAWLPLWFGNEHVADDRNPTYGTAKVLIALRELKERGFAIPREIDRRAAEWLVSAQQEDGGWGGDATAPASVEETGLAVEALAGVRAQAAERGAAWLLERIERGDLGEPAPIGLYFARLWYFERLYPLIFTCAALGKMQWKADFTIPPPH